MSSLPHKLVRNTLSSAAAYAISLVLSLLLTPYMLTKLGTEQFGIWVILAVTITYFGLLDLGVGTAFIKHLTDALTKQDQGRCNEIMATGCLFYLIFGVFILMCALLAENVLLSFLNIPHDVLLVYRGVLAIAIIRRSFMIYRSLLFALQRLEVLNAIVIATAVLNAVLTVTVLAAGYGLNGLVIASLLVALIQVSAEIVMAYRLCTGLTLRLTRASLSTFRLLFRYGIHIQASRTAEMVHMHFDKIVLSHFLGLSQVTLYELGSKIAGVTRSLPTVLLPAILPAAAELQAKQDLPGLRKLYERGSKYLVVMVMPLALFTVVAADGLMNAWLGPGSYAGAVLALRMLAVSYMFYLLTGMGTAVARGIGVVHYEMKATVASALLNVGLSLLLVVKLGLAGVLVATLVSLIVRYTYFIYYFHIYMTINIMSYIKNVYAVPFAGSMVAATLVLAGGYPMGLVEFTTDQSRVASLLNLFLQGVLFLAVYGGIVLKSRYVAIADWQLVRKALAPAPS